MDTLRQEEPPVTIFRECWENAAPAAPSCFPDSSGQCPAWLTPGEFCWWWDVQDGAIELSGLRIPLTTRWILCPAHQHIAQEDMEARERS